MFSSLFRIQIAVSFDSMVCVGVRNTYLLSFCPLSTNDHMLFNGSEIDLEPFLRYGRENVMYIEIEREYDMRLRGE